MVTVASAASSSAATGRPTMHRAARAPGRARPPAATPASASSFITPAGVQGTSPRPPVAAATGVQRMEPVHVLGRIDRLDHRLRGDLLRQRHLHQDAVHRRSAFSRAISASSSPPRRIGRQADRVRGDAGRAGRAVLAAHIDRAGRIVAHQHHRQPRPVRQARRRRRRRRERSAAATALPSMMRAVTAPPASRQAAGSPATCSIFSRLVAPSTRPHRRRRDIERPGQCDAGSVVSAPALRRLGRPRCAGARRRLMQRRPAGPVGATSAAPSPPL